MSTPQQRQHKAQWFAIAVPIAVVAATFVALRFGTGALGAEAGTGRYDLGFGLNVIENAAISTVGFLAVGPSHLVSAPDASFAARASAPVGALLTLAMLLMGASRLGARPSRRWEVAVCGAMLAYAAVGPSLITHHVSEYYLFGPNAIIACFVGVALASLLMQPPPPLLKVALGGAAVMWAAIAIFGVVARADSIAVHWEQVRIIDADVMDIIEATSPNSQVTVVFPEELATGPRHGVFYSTPAHLYDLPLSSEFLSEATGITVDLVDEPPPGPGSPTMLDVTLPARKTW